MKSFATKLSAIVFVFALATGCASSITSPIQSQPQQKTITKAPAPGNVLTSGGGEDMISDVEKPM